MVIGFYIKLISDTVPFLNKARSVHIIMNSQEQNMALVAISNPITSGRISTIMKEKNWTFVKTSDGDEAVDYYVKNKPGIVFISLDLSTINGHVTALEIREIDPGARIVFISSKTRISKVEDAAYSAGAVGILTTPLTKTKINEKWDNFFLEIPEAPGLADLDTLYPEIKEKEEEENILPPLPPLPPLTQIPDILNFPQENKRKRKWIRIILPLVILSSLTLYFLLNQGYIKITKYMP
ncbi:MAG: response regulator [Candidatus Poseidoniales archaeon]|nr:MAG: response regulator [Candidatus Poseidoniales archaeon]